MDLTTLCYLGDLCGTIGILSFIALVAIFV
jgi:hypothetical protein